MNYSYGDKKDSDIIKNYKINKKDKTIVINFLDGTKYVAPYSIENENDVLDRMLSQAIERNGTCTLDKMVNKNVHYFICGLVNAIICANDVIYSFSVNHNNSKIVLYVAGGITLSLSLVSGVISLNCSEEIKELRKYKLYLSLRDKIAERSFDSNIFNGVKCKKNLNINTLDSYSLTDLKKIKINLLRSKSFDNLLITDTNELDNEIDGFVKKKI